MIACYYALVYLGFAAPYLVDGLGTLAGKTGAFVVALTAIIAGLTLWTAGYAAIQKRAVRDQKGDALVSSWARSTMLPRSRSGARRCWARPTSTRSAVSCTSA